MKIYLETCRGVRQLAQKQLRLIIVQIFTISLLLINFLFEIPPKSKSKCIIIEIETSVATMPSLSVSCHHRCLRVPHRLDNDDRARIGSSSLMAGFIDSANGQ